MPCVPTVILPKTGSKPADAFAFSPSAGVAERSVANLAVMATMPWTAFWTVTFEALNPDNYRF